MFLFFFFFPWPWSMWDLSSLTRDRTHSPHVLEDEVLTTGLPGMSPKSFSILAHLTLKPLYEVMAWYSQIYKCLNQGTERVSDLSKIIVIRWTGIWTKAILLLTTVLYFWFEMVCTSLTVEPLGLDCCAPKHLESAAPCSHCGLHCDFPCTTYRTLQVEKRKNVAVISRAGMSTPAYPACVRSCFSHVWLFVTLCTVDPQASLFMGFSGQEYWSGSPCPPQGIFLTQGSSPHLVTSPALAGFFTTSAAWEAPSNPTSCY